QRQPAPCSRTASAPPTRKSTQQRCRQVGSLGRNIGRGQSQRPLSIARENPPGSFTSRGRCALVIQGFDKSGLYQGDATRAFGVGRQTRDFRDLLVCHRAVGSHESRGGKGVEYRASSTLRVGELRRFYACRGVTLGRWAWPRGILKRAQLELFGAG